VQAFARAMNLIFRILGKTLKLVINAIKIVVGALDKVIDFVKSIAQFFKRAGKKMSGFFDKLEEFFQKFKEYLKRKEKSPDTEDLLPDDKDKLPEKNKEKVSDKDNIPEKDETKSYDAGKSKERNYEHGQGEGGPGTWENRTTPQKGAEYQEKVTGASSNSEYVVKTDKMKSGEKKFDGYDPDKNSLIDAKDWTDWPPKGQKWAEDKVIKEAKNDLNIARETGCKLEYHVPTIEKAEQLRKLFDKNGLEELIVIVTPK
jgi:hypothetical protein